MSVTSCGLGPLVTLSSTWTSSPRRRPIMVASRPIGPAPVTSALFGSQRARRPIRSTCSQALARIVVGMAHDPGDQVARGQLAALGRLQHAAERLVAEHQPLVAGRRPAVVAVDDL